MSTYVLMRLLESAPRRYDRGIRLLTLGAVDRAYDHLTAAIHAGERVLDIGCGTGALALRAARRGARVKAIDINAEMLALAAGRARAARLADAITFAEMGIAELGREPDATYDVVTAGLVFSELSPDERRFALREVRRLLRPGGRLLVADETAPGSRLGRWFYAIARAPLVVLTYLLTQQTTHPLGGLVEEIRTAGFRICSVRRSALGSFLEIVAERPADPGP